jgi:site-specific DNA-cytosine methylase
MSPTIPRLKKKRRTCPEFRSKRYRRSRTNSYQVRFSVLQAGVYGSPQHRRRVIFWGARRGLPLPEFPIPTHNFGSSLWAVQLDTGLKLDHVTRDPDRPHRGAPLRAVTVDDVISDLVSLSRHSVRCQAHIQSHHSFVLLLTLLRLRLAAQV